MKRNILKRAISYVLPLAVTMGTIQVPFAASAQTQVKRPPQYVLLAFDGSYRDRMWKFLRKFSAEHEQKNVDVRFTFFINPVYLLERSKGLQVYHPPGGHKGSNIGWGDNRQDISQRLDNIDGAYAEHHEIGSHAVGHWDGGTWSAADWKSEFTQFYSIMDNVFRLNNLPERELKYMKSIRGFRAPLLGWSKGLYQEMPQFGLRYDTSQQSEVTNYWPQVRNDGSKIWNFPLARVAIPGTAKHYPTMDYNFCANDTLELLRKNPDLINFKGPEPMTRQILSNRGHGDCLQVLPPKDKEFIKNRTLAAYMAYFNSNYYGNRAPVSIGHHFSEWMSGAYFEAMMQVAENVCNKPEVKCVTYSELMNFMNEKTASGEVAFYKKGAFNQLPRPKAIHEEVALDINADMVKDGDMLKMLVSGRDANMKGLKTQFYVDGKVIPGNTISLNEVRGLAPVGSQVQVGAVVLNRQGIEVQSATHLIENVGTRDESFHTESLESTFLKGDLPAAHEGANAEDFSSGN